MKRVSLGIDVGNGNTKFGNQIFESKVEGTMLLGDFGKREVGTHEVTYKGRTYIVGKGKSFATKDRHTCRSYQLCLLTAIALSTEENDIDASICFGVPTLMYISNKDRVKEIVDFYNAPDMKNHIITVDGCNKKITINAAYVFAENALPLMQDDDENQILVDIGEGTVNISQWVNQAPVKIDTKENESSFLGLYNRIALILKSMANADISTRFVQNHLCENSVVVNGKEYTEHQLRIKLIESDRLCTPKSYGESIDLHEKNPDTGNRIINGIEIDDHGTVVAYHICSSYPSEYDTVSSEWTRVEAIGKKTGNPNIIHVMEAERCEQYRGVPFLSPVIESLKQLTRYQEAEIMAAVINGMFAVFIKTESGNDDVDFDGVDEGENRVDEENESSYELGNGIINVLKEGESIEIADAKRPNSNFDGFMTAMTKYIGAALEIPVELVTKSFTASYSASRAALLEAWKMFRMRRTWFANDFCKPIYEIWFAEAVAKGRINAPGFFNDPLVRKAYCGSEWVGPAPGQLDPVKEATGAKLRIENGFSTHETEAAEINGSSFDSNIEQLRVENKKLQEVNKEE